MERQFKNRMKSVGTILLALPGILIVACIVGLVAWWLFGDIMALGRFSNVAIWGSVATGLLIVLLFLLRIPSYPDYAISKKGVFILKRGEVVKSFPFSRYQVRPHVVSVQYGVVPMPKNRAIIVEEPGSTPKRIIININKRDYVAFMELLEKYG